MAFVLLRAGAGLATALYDPAARGYLTDATPPERRGEAFGLYGAVQMGGLLVGPAIGALGAERFGGVAFVFVFGGVAAVLAAIPIGLRVREGTVRTHPAPSPDATEFPTEAPSTTRRAAEAIAADQGRSGVAPASGSSTVASSPRSSSTPAAIFAGGTYEVIWSLFLTHLGAGLDLVGLTFAMFGLPVLLLSPYAGRVVDRRGALAFIVIGSILPAVMGLLYTRITDPLWAVPMILIEATGFAMLNPALYAVVAANSPPGRSSTAQGLFGAAGTVGFIVASLLAGVLAETDIVYPLYVFSAVLTHAGDRADRRTGTPERPQHPEPCRPRGAGRLTELVPGRTVSSRGVEQRQLVGLITRRSEVRNPLPATNAFTLNPGPDHPGFFLSGASGRTLSRSP